MEYKLKDVCEILTKTINPKKNPEQVYDLYSLPSFDNNKKIEKIEGKYINSNKIIIKGKLVLFNKLNLKFKRIWNVNIDNDKSICSTEFLPIKANLELLDNDYLYYMLLTDKLNNYLIESSTGTSNSHQRINKNLLLEQETFLPSINEQIKIVKILKIIDQKIELNNKINDNLFKFAINYLNSKQEENQVPIINFANIQGGYAFKSKDLIDKPTNNRIIKIKNLRTEINVDIVNSQFVEDEIISNLDTKFKLEKGDVIIAMTGAELGKTGIIYGFDKYYLNQRVGVIRGKSEERELYLKILALSDEFQVLLNSKGYGSAQPNISAIDIENILIRDITENNLKDIYEKLNPIYYKIIYNCEENLNLEQLRDALLPKLMNGEIDLDKVEI